MLFNMHCNFFLSQADLGTFIYRITNWFLHRISFAGGETSLSSLINAGFRLQVEQRWGAYTHLFTDGLPYHCIPFFLVQSALKISQLSFFLAYPMPLPCALPHFHLICPQFSIPTGIFVSLLPSCPFHSPFFSPDLFLSGCISIFHFVFSSYSSFEDA